jgi:hypothetical protein
MTNHRHIAFAPTVAYTNDASWWFRGTGINSAAQRGPLPRNPAPVLPRPKGVVRPLEDAIAAAADVVRALERRGRLALGADVRAYVAAHELHEQLMTLRLQAPDGHHAVGCDDCSADATGSYTRGERRWYSCDEHARVGTVSL